MIELAEVALRSAVVGCFGQSDGFEIAEINAVLVHFDLCSPAAIFLAPQYTTDTRSVVSQQFSVSVVLRVRGLSEVSPAVIVFDLIDVVDLVDGPPPEHEHESQAVRFVHLSANIDAKIAFIVSTADRPS